MIISVTYTNYTSSVLEIDSNFNLSKDNNNKMTIGTRCRQTVHTHLAVIPAVKSARQAAVIVSN